MDLAYFQPLLYKHVCVSPSPSTLANRTDNRRLRTCAYIDLEDSLSNIALFPAEVNSNAYTAYMLEDSYPTRAGGLDAHIPYGHLTSALLSHFSQVILHPYLYAFVSDMLWLEWLTRYGFDYICLYEQGAGGEGAQEGGRFHTMGVS
ncbi:hypothetical protein EDD15DRAFT_2518166 [Pisolithus albus]|nr:hypothetical protein EDD15DRAFT_2518166 [Pisolithus albus]